MQRLLPHFDPTLNWGHILTAGSFCIFGVIAFFSLQRDVVELRVETRTRMAVMEKNLSLLTENVIKVSDQILVDVRQTERLDQHDRRFEIESRRLDRLEVNVFKLVPLELPRKP